MPAPRENPIRFVPRTVSDTADGANSPPGACSSLSNLQWSPDTPGVLVCRPANTKLTTFPGLSSPGIVSAAFQLNGIIYGMIASASPAGHDRPFAYNVAADTFQTVSGVTAANTPVTPASTGAWTPPTMDMVGSRIIVTHPGFNFAGGYAFGYFDLSGFSVSLTGDVISGSPVVQGSFSIAGVGPGYTISGTGIPANTTVLNTGTVNFTTTGTTHSNTTVDGIASTAAMFVGQQISGAGIPAGTTIAGITSGVAITISQAATASATVSLAVSGQTITMSANATGSHNAEAIAVAGGTAAAPLWAAGNTTGVLQLASLPQAVKQFYNRAYFAAGNQLIFTDTLALNISNVNSVQVLTIGDTSAITGLGALPVEQTTGGVLEALIAFKQYSISQITGDDALGDLAQDQLSGTVGTAAGRSIVPTPQGLGFMASDGARNITLSGQVSEPNSDLAVPFIFAQYPSRVCAAFNSDAYRICVQNTKVLNAPFQEFHYYLKYDGWSGPHTFRADCIVPYSNDFIVFNNDLPGTMWKSYAVQGHNAEGNTFVENGAQLVWSYITAPLLANENMYANAVVHSTLDMALSSSGNMYNFQASDTRLGVLALASVTAPDNEAIWDAFNWGDGTLWGAEQQGLAPITIPWTEPLIFNRLILQGSGNSALDLEIGAWYVGYEKLGYLQPT